jgi:hypothetical protein
LDQYYQIYILSKAPNLNHPNRIKNQTRKQNGKIEKKRNTKKENPSDGPEQPNSSPPALIHLCFGESAIGGTYQSAETIIIFIFPSLASFIHR